MKRIILLLTFLSSLALVLGCESVSNGELENFTEQNNKPVDSVVASEDLPIELEIITEEYKADLREAQNYHTPILISNTVDLEEFLFTYPTQWSEEQAILRDLDAEFFKHSIIYAYATKEPLGSIELSVNRAELAGDTLKLFMNRFHPGFGDTEIIVRVGLFGISKQDIENVKTVETKILDQYFEEDNLVHSSADYEQSMEKYKELQNWSSENPDFPYAGAFIDNLAILNILVKNLDDDLKEQLISLFGNEINILDVEFSLRELNDVYLELQREAELLKEKGVPLDHVYLSEKKNKVFISLKQVKNSYIDIITDVIGEYPFIDYDELDNTHKGYDYAGPITAILAQQKGILVEVRDDIEYLFPINEDTKIVGFELSDLKIGDRVKINAPYPINEDELPFSTLAARIALDN